MKSKSYIPADGLAGLKDNIQTDALSGFLVFLLALPLSLGIASASDFPPIYGLATAMIGGLIVSFFAGSLLTIKGPAAGLIVIVAGAVAEFGQGNATLGWQLTLGAIVVAGLLQVLFGVLKFGKLNDFFPLNAVEGMLAAIGIIILSKQLHILLGVNPVSDETGKALVEPIELIKALPNSFANINTASAIIGFVSLALVLGLPLIKNKSIKKIPIPLIVLLVAIPLSFAIGLKEASPKGYISFDKGLLDILAINVKFDGISQTGTFIKYVLMFALVGSLEALLTVKAIDNMDHYKRKSNYNKDLIAVGIGNVLAGIIGGVPMISEVARSSANVNNGAKTRWANFFHGFSLLLFLLFATYFSNLIPKSALAALLIGVGIKLAHPIVFKHMFHVGKEQLLIFCITVIMTLASDLLIGIGAGILTKILVEMFHGASFSKMFSNNFEVIYTDDSNVKVNINGEAVFTNLIKLKAVLYNIPEGKHIIIDCSKSKLIDHTTILAIYQFERDYEFTGGIAKVTGFETHKQLSHAKTSVRVLKKIN